MFRLSTIAIFKEYHYTKEYMVLDYTVVHNKWYKYNTESILLLSIGPRWLMPRMYAAVLAYYTTLRRSRSHC